MYFKSYVGKITTHEDLLDEISHITFSPFFYYILSVEESIWDAVPIANKDDFTTNVHNFLQTSDDGKITFIDRLYKFTCWSRKTGTSCNILCRLDLYGKYYVFADLRCTDFLEVFKITFICNPLNLSQFKYSSEVMQSLHRFLREDGYEIKNEAEFHWPRKSWVHAPTLYHICKKTLYSLYNNNNFLEMSRENIPLIIFKDIEQFIHEKNLIKKDRFSLKIRFLINQYIL